ncbi:MAG: tRNA pseudouridine(55) synthase TruB [Acholeplasmataceae bacterium]|nr:tRNA pseudouridine(55) synthase TruB [Acholeplasmataceae bacterium]
MNGFLLIDKPQGMTSHDVVSKIKRKFHLDKVGHTGTLDPFASGLLILCIGKATRLSYLFSNLDKTYRGTIKFGVHYDTFDITGTKLKTDNKEIIQELVEKEMKNLTGSYEQLPPMFSAIKINGRKLYDLAREGKEVEREKRHVKIHAFHIIDKIDDKTYEFFTSVSKGTYIRSLAVDLAERLDTCAALETLTRLSVGKYDLNHAKTIEEVTKDDMITLETYFKKFPTIMLNDYMIKLVKNGVYLDERQIITDQPFIVCDQNNEMIAYYEVVNQYQYKPIIVF